LHVEKRSQQLPRRTAQLSIFESKLTPGQMQDLRMILDKEEIRTLPTFVFPRGHVGPEGFDGFEAKIARGMKIQHVGYVIVAKAASERSGGSSSDNLKNQWTSSEKALSPLVQWLSEVTPTAAISYGHSSLCEVRKLNQ
jgi:hypothetical protein